MGKNADLVRLAEQAQLGEKGAFARLAEAAGERLRTDVYRLTIDHNLTDEIVQESLLEMFRILGNLRDPDKFWPCLYKIALNKVRRHYRTEQRRRTVPMSAIDQADVKKDGAEAMADAVSHELKEIVFAAMRELKPRHRAVLTMRCYREMEYSLIAEAMGCSEFAAKMLFYRAKKTLKRQLSRQGLGKGSLLFALVLFGKMTASSEAAAAQVSISAAAVKVGAATAAAGILANKTTVVSLTAASVLAVGTMVATQETDRAGVVSRQRAVRSSEVTTEAGRVSSEEYWYYYPPKADGAVVLRLMKEDSKGRSSYCQRLQNEEANYDFDRWVNVIHINNARLWHRDLSVWRLPTDGVKLQRFLSRVEGKRFKSEYVSGVKDGLMVVKRSELQGGGLWTTRHYNVLNEEYFRYNWPAGTEVVDNRDAMHRRGWTYFRVTGKVAGETVSGVGRIPFVYAASLKQSAWLRMQVGGLKIEDNGTEARVYDSGGSVVSRYKGGIFLKGLARPWMGLHTVDTVRRDAAEKQVWFESSYAPESGKAEVVLTSGRTRLVYTIDLEKDVVEKIRLSGSNGREGELRFSYLQEIDETGSEFIPPTTKTYRTSQRKSIDTLWLVRLAEGGLK